MWILDASIAFLIVLILAQLSLVWLDTYVDSTTAFNEINSKQKQLIAASDQLINDPNCLAKEDGAVARTLPQTIDTKKLGNEAAHCHRNYTLGEAQGDITVKRLVFLDEEGGEIGVLKVW